MSALTVRKVLSLRGPNIWAHFPVLEAWVDLGDLKDTSSAMIPGFNDRLMNWLPTLIEHRCSIGERGGFFQRLRDGTYLAHILEHVTLELQSLAGSDVGFGRARETSEEGVYKVAVEFEEEHVARECFAVGVELCLAAVHDRPFDVPTARLRALCHEIRLGPSTRSIVEAARARGIPALRLNTGSLVQLGHGAWQRRILAAETDKTSAIAQEIAQDKELTKTLLRAVGVPVPAGEPVSNAEEAWQAAQEIGLPVVVKPRDGNQGRGVSTRLTTREQVQTAYDTARREGESVIVEKFIPGHDYRLLVVDGKVVAAAQREPARVQGDGVHTVAQLVEEANRDPRRSDGHATVLSMIPLDERSVAILAEQGLAPDSVPAAGTTVLLRRNANLSTGGTARDVTDDVHPDIARQAVEAVRAIGLDIGGADVVAADLLQPLEEQGGAIVEVNAGPGLRMHLEPSVGRPRPVGAAIVNSLFPAGETGRIPLVAVTGANGKTTTTRLVAHMLRGYGWKVGMTCTDGIFIDGRRIDKEDCSGPQSARAVLMNRLVEAAVLETARGGILREGLGFDSCDVAVVTNIGEGDHLGLSDIQTLEQLARVKRTIVEAVSPQGTAVLNAADPLVAAMAPHCPGSVLYFARDASHPLIVLHSEMGKRTVFVRDGAIVLAEGNRQQSLVPLADVPVSHGGRIGFQVENALAAAGAAWALGIPVATIAAGLRTFGADRIDSPGRFNVLQYRGGTLVVDYGHNTSALAALIDALAPLPGRRTIVYSIAGDRRDSDMIQQGRLLAGAFERVFLYEDHYLRGRSPGEIIALLRRGLEGTDRTREVREFHSWPEAAEEALHVLGPGELVVIQADVIDEAVQFLQPFLDGSRKLPDRLQPAAAPALAVALPGK